MIHTSVRLPEDLETEVRKLCEKRGVSFSALFQTAIRNEIRNHQVSDMEKRINSVLGTLGKRVDKSVEANRAGFALFLALTEELLSHIYQDSETAEAQVKNVVDSAQRNFAGTVKDFLGDANGK